MFDSLKKSFMTLVDSYKNFGKLSTQDKVNTVMMTVFVAGAAASIVAGVVMMGHC